MSRQIAIVQSSYIPWRGYFSLIARCAAFVFLDSVQFTRRDWRTRNAIKTTTGLSWLSIPVKQKGNYTSPIDAIQIADPGWSKQHMRAIEGAYRRAETYKTVFPVLAEAFLEIRDQTALSVVNQRLIGAICRMLGIETPLLRDVDLLPRERLEAMDPTERLINLVKAVGADEYVSGPTAREYIDERRFHEAGINVTWMEYSACLTPYPQLWHGFEPAVSIVDPILNLGFDETSRMIAQLSNVTLTGRRTMGGHETRIY